MLNDDAITGGMVPRCPMPKQADGHPDCVEVDVTHCGDACVSVAVEAATKLSELLDVMAAETCSGPGGKLLVTFTADAFAPGNATSRLRTAWGRVDAVLRGVTGSKTVQLPVNKVTSEAEWHSAHNTAVPTGDDTYAFAAGLCFSARVDAPFFRRQPPALNQPADLAAHMEAALSADASGVAASVHRRGATLWVKASALHAGVEGPPASRGGRAASGTLSDQLQDPSYMRWVRATRGLEELATALSGFVEPHLKAMYAAVQTNVPVGMCNNAACNDMDLKPDVVGGSPTCATCKAWTDEVLKLHGLGERRKVAWPNVRLGWISHDTSGWEM